MFTLRSLQAFLACSIAGLAIALPVHAAAPEAWESHRAEVIAKCAKASGLKDARLIGELIEYDDTVGYTAALIGGTYPQPHMRNRPGRSLCLFDKRSRTASAAPADSLQQAR